jgi:5-methylcytosine-specific restriction protein A
VRDAAARRLTLRQGELFDDDAGVVWAAFIDYVSSTKPDPETGAQLPLKARFADALVAMAHAYLELRGGVAHRPLAFVHIDARVLTGEQGWAETGDSGPLAAETARRLACACKLAAVADDTRGNPLNLGRRSREASWQQVELLRRRDGGCRLCGAQLFLQAHHIKWWDRDRGRTDMANLVMACQTCHHLVHEGAWVIEGDANAELRFISPRGTVVRRAPRAGPPGG